MKRIPRIAFAATAAALLFASLQTPAWARATSNARHGMTCYNYPVLNADGSTSYERRCFKRH